MKQFNRYGWLVMFALVPVAAFAADERLTVTQDSKSMEQTIARYLTATHKRVIGEKTRPNATNDVYLSIIIRGDNEATPNYQFIIDTFPSYTANDGKVLARAVKIDLFTNVMVPAEKRDAALRILNDYTRKSWFCAGFIDVNGDLVLTWTLDVLADGLPTENVHDMLYRLQSLWRELAPKLAPLVKPTL
jgi:hypothetical protein